ncbi:hypothetical protein LH128_24923 [Sphingomonas sp. LH128]|nr:hypothetical protein LH128_24923 [Sphingomonas sp. LH128]
MAVAKRLTEGWVAIPLHHRLRRRSPSPSLRDREDESFDESHPKRLALAISPFDTIPSAAKPFRNIADVNKQAIFRHFTPFIAIANYYQIKADAKTPLPVAMVFQGA